MDLATQRPLARIERLCREARSPQQLTESVGASLAELTGADAHVFVVLDPLTGMWTAGSDRGHAHDSCAQYRERAFLRSPFADYAGVSRGSERLVRLTRGEAPREDPYVALFLHGYGFLEELHVSFAVAGQGHGHLTLSKLRERFDPREQRLVEACVAPVTAHLRRLVARELVEAVPGEHLALLFVDAAGALSPANAAGAALLAANRARGTLFTTPFAVAGELARRALAEPDAPPPPPLTFVDPASQRRYRLVAEAMLPDGGEPRALLLAEPVRALDSVELLRKAGLTEREAEVALAALRGFRSAEGADALRISEHTFLGHLKATYKKLGVGSRAELAALLLGAA